MDYDVWKTAHPYREIATMSAAAFAPPSPLWRGGSQHYGVCSDEKRDSHSHR